MLWFNRKRSFKDATNHTTVDGAHVIEIVAHKDATKEVVQQAKAANEKLTKLFDENGFTVKIVLAMGAKQQRKGATNHGH